tara:strand:+ start:3285 stop:3584 length:300 start_codon:yes stop_codon:yes gene_type:complete
MFVIMENNEIISTNLDLGNIEEEAMVMEEMGRSVAVVEMDPLKFETAMKKWLQVLEETEPKLFTDNKAMTEMNIQARFEIEAEMERLDDTVNMNEMEAG